MIMKSKFVLLIATVGLISFSSCKKCYECQYGTSPATQKLCKPSSTSWSGWNDYIKELEDNGYTCN